MAWRHEDWGSGAYSAVPGGHAAGGSVRTDRAAAVWGEGWLAFMSERPLTGYDNRDVVSGRPDEEVYVY